MRKQTFSLLPIPLQSRVEILSWVKATLSWLLPESMNKTTPQHKLFSNPTRALSIPCKILIFQSSQRPPFHISPSSSSLHYKAFPKKTASSVAHFFSSIHSSSLTKNVRKKTETSCTLPHTWGKKHFKSRYASVCYFTS